MTTRSTRWALLVDRSGSMQTIAQETVALVNQTMQAIKEQASKNGSLESDSVTLVTFGENIREEYFNASLQTLKPFTSANYVAAGGTPLFDAVGNCCEKFSSMQDANDLNVSFVVMVITDGAENTSQRWNASSVTQLIRKLQNTDHWTVTFQVPQGTAAGFARATGVANGNIREWNVSAQGMQGAAVATSAGISNFYTDRAAGKSASKNFYVQPDLSKFTGQEVRETLQRLTDKVQVSHVDSEQRIDEFFTKWLGNYQKGTGFYQLVKSETVQASKLIMLRDRKSHAVYGGKTARDLIGLPVGVASKVRVGDHNRWDIFVQSTSVNRKLVAGSKVLFVEHPEQIK